MIIRVIGDTHGYYGRYKKIIKKGGFDKSVCVGDMGVGFRRSNGNFYTNPPYDTMVKTNSFYIRGNHDNPNVCKKHTQWIPDGHYENNMMFIGGAKSIDRHHRTEDYDWWPDEECSYNQFYKFMDDYESLKPKIMVTHDCPLRIAALIQKSHHAYDKSITQQALQAMFELDHKPELWLFGHHHISTDIEVDGTRFICLNELEYIDIEINENNIQVIKH